MKFFFKRYIAFEEQYGTSSIVKKVRSKAMEFVETRFIDSWSCSFNGNNMLVPYTQKHSNLKESKAKPLIKFYEESQCGAENLCCYLETGKDMVK